MGHPERDSGDVPLIEIRGGADEKYPDEGRGCVLHVPLLSIECQFALSRISSRS
jgi:hypothetical protein